MILGGDGARVNRGGHVLALAGQSRVPRPRLSTRQGKTFRSALLDLDIGAG